ncbi:MAG: Nramp family divalent metal transporter [Pirellulaceae bacterium]|nr:Nramp family divalent metal transporter [Pirellulaceae bacterium]
MSDAKQEDDLYRQSAEFRDPPVGFWPTVRFLGPGLVLVGSIVGSGELILTTKLGAQAGFVMLWFVIASCIVKVVVQAELVRHIISSGETILEVLNKLPGPSCLRPGWFTMGWLIAFSIATFAAITAYLYYSDASVSGRCIAGLAAATLVGCIVYMVSTLRGGGRSPESSASLKHSGELPRINWFMILFIPAQLAMFVNTGGIIGGAGQALEMAFGSAPAEVWAVVVAIISYILLMSGGYRSLEGISVALVATFTLITLICTVLLQWTPFQISWSDLSSGMTFGLPDPLPPIVVLTILSVYAATGIGHWEMFSYTYWCIEKGYARHAGKRDESEAWVRRARGWVRVMYIDSVLTMFIYTLSTICFYLLGAAILNRKGIDPSGYTTLSDLESIYIESLGSAASVLFISGAFFVLFSTVISAAASGSRIIADAFCVLGFLPRDDFSARKRVIQISVVASLVLFGYTFFLFKDPPFMLMMTSMIAVFSYPSLGIGAIYLRHKCVDQRIQPGAIVTVMLWVSGVLLGVASPVMALTYFYLRTNS